MPNPINKSLLLFVPFLSACSLFPVSNGDLKEAEIEAFQSSKSERKIEVKEISLYEEIEAEDAAKELEKLWAAADPLEEEEEDKTVTEDTNKKVVQLSAERVYYEKAQEQQPSMIQAASQETKSPTVTIGAINESIQASSPPPPSGANEEAAREPTVDPKVQEIVDRIANSGGQQAKKSMLKAEMRKLGYSVKHIPILKALKNEVPQYLHGMIDDRVDEILDRKRNPGLS